MSELECYRTPDTDGDGEDTLTFDEEQILAIQTLVKFIVCSKQTCCPTHLTMHLFDYVDELVVEQMEASGEVH